MSDSTSPRKGPFCIGGNLDSIEHKRDCPVHRNKPAVGAPRNWPHGYLECGCRNDGTGRHVR